LKILELNLTAFGPFTDRTLDLGGGNPGLHVVFGPNEAGKSSALRALHAALYGFPQKTPDAFLHPYDGLRVGARLRHSDGTEIGFVRRKGNKGTLLAADGSRLDDPALDRFLGGESAEKFKRFWGIDYPRLVQGGREILEGRGDLGEILFAAGSGVSDLRKILGTLENEASALYVPRGQQRTVNQRIGTLRELRVAQREATVSADEWARREQTSRDATETVTRLANEGRGLEGEQSRIGRLKRVLPMLAERKGLQTERATLTDVVLLSEDFPARRQAAETALLTARQNCERTENELHGQDERVARLGQTPPLVAEAERVNPLHVDLGTYRKALSDRPGLLEKCNERRALAKRLLAEWRPDLALENAGGLRPFVARRARIQKLAGERERLDERLASAAREGAKAAEQKEALDREVSPLPQTRDVERLVIAINEARRGGDAEDQRDKTAQAVKRLTTQRDTLIEKLGLPATAADHPEKWGVPGGAMIARFEARDKEVEDAARATESERQRLDREIRTLDALIETLRKKKAIPTEEELAAARSRRDDTFDLLRERWERGPDATGAGELAGEIIKRYPQTVAEADQIADRLRAEAEQVAKLAQQREDRERLGKEREDAEEAGCRQKEAAAQIASDWRAAWEGVPVTPPSIEETRAWQTDFGGLLAKSETLTGAREEMEQRDGWIGKQVKSLYAAMSELDSDARSFAGLAEALATAERLQARVEKENQARTDHARRTNENVQAAIGSDKAKRAAQVEIAEWQGKWTEAIGGLLPGDAAPPDDALAALDTIEKALNAIKEAEEYDQRIAGIDRDATRFRDDVRALALRLGEQQEDEGRWVDSIHNRLAEALQEEERRRQAAERQTRLQEEIARYLQALQEAELALATLRSEARCAPEADLVAIEERSTERKNCDAAIGRIERELVRGGDGASIEELEAEAAGVDRDTLDARAEEIGMRLVETEKTLTAAREAQATARAEMARLQEGTGAGEKAEEIQATLARLREDVVQYSRLRVASTLLARRIDDYRRRNQAPMLLRAGALFREITLRSFERLEADVDDDRPILTGVRPDGKQVPADGMSEGTRDQLFLALRLAAVEKSCVTGEPLPFIVDDVLVQFDDQRTAAGLRVLADIATRTQVVLFTHHGSVRASAEAMHAPGQVIVHEL
jgi:uncharacterized protein YhaN